MKISILVLIVAAFVFNNNKVIVGRLVVSDKPALYNINNVSIIIKANNNLYDTIITDSAGQFSFSFPSKLVKDIDILYTGIGFGTVYLRHIKTLNYDTTKLYITIPAQYKKNLFGKVLCPKCNKADETYKIEYADSPVYTFQINNDGDTTFSAIRNGVYQGGSCVSTLQSAQWHCDRDKIEF